MEEATSRSIESFALGVSVANVLTWPSSTPDFGGRDVRGLELCNVCIKRHLRPVASQNLLAQWIDFALEYYMRSSPLKSKIEPANAREKRSDTHLLLILAPIVDEYRLHFAFSTGKLFFGVQQIFRMSNANICGGRIKQARERLGWQQVELAAALHVDFSIKLEQSDISEIERGVRTVKDYELDAFARVLGVSPMWLLRGNGDADDYTASH